MMMSSSEPSRLVLPDLDDQGALHLLRHFCSVSSREASRLASSFSATEISEAMGRAGSLFNPAVIDGPYALQSFLSSRQSRLVEVSDARAIQVWRWDLSPESFSQGIGWDGLIAVSDIAAENQKLLSRKFRFSDDPEPILVYQAPDPKITWTVHAVLSVASVPLGWITVFPGTWAPPFPDEERYSADENRLYREFWQSHALIESDRSKF